MLNKNHSFIQWLKYNEFRLIGFAFILSVVLGYLGFYQYYESANENAEAFHILYLSFQLFVMESGAVDKPELAPLSLHIARWLAPGVLGYTVLKTILSVLKHEIYLLKLRNYKNHVIICGLGTKGQRLADTFHERGEKVVIIEKNADNNLINHYKVRGVIILIENALDLTSLKKARVEHSKYLITVTDNDIANVNVLIHAKEIKSIKNKNPFLTCFAHIQDTKLKALLYDHEIFYKTYENFDARIFNVYENGARVALHKYSPDRFCKVVQKTDPSLHVLILGYGKLGEAIATQLLRVAHYRYDKKTMLTIVDEKASIYEKKLKTRIPSLDEIADIRFITKDPDILNDESLSELQSVQPFTIIYFCLEDETSEIDTLTRFKLLLYNTKTIFVVFTRPGTPIPESLKNHKRIRIVELINEACSADVVVDEELDKLAMLIHNDYLKRAKDDYQKILDDCLQKGKEAPKPKPIMVEWDKLNEEYRDNNRSQADHIDVKLRAIECKACSLDDKQDEFNFTSDKEIMTDLAKMEHRRWNANRWLAGWRLGERNDELKTHPDLLPWEKLNTEIQDYDIEAVANIPNLLKANKEKVCKTV